MSIIGLLEQQYRWPLFAIYKRLPQAPKRCTITGTPQIPTSRTKVKVLKHVNKQKRARTLIKVSKQSYMPLLPCSPCQTNDVTDCFSTKSNYHKLYYSTSWLLWNMAKREHIAVDCLRYFSTRHTPQRSCLRHVILLEQNFV